MARFFAKHLLFVCLTPLVVSSVVFVPTEFVPGDVARKMLRADATQEQPEVPTKQIGLDRSVAACLVEYDDCLTQGDLVARHRNRSAADRPQGGRPA